MKEILLRWGIPSYVTNIISPVPVQAQLTIPIAKTIPQQIGYIFGMNIYTDSADPNNDTLISYPEAQNLYMVLKDGPTEFFQLMRLDSLVNTIAGFPNVNPDSYTEVAIPGNFDLSTSYYQNPAGVVSTIEPAVSKTIMLQMWFVSTESYLWLMKKGVIDASYAEQFIRSKR